MAAGRCRRVPDATAPADLPSLVMIEVVGVSDRRHPGTLDESHQLGEPGDVRGVVSAWRSLGQRVKDKLHALGNPSHLLEMVVLVAANLVATAVRFVLLRGWVFHRHCNS